MYESVGGRMRVFCAPFERSYRSCSNNNIIKCWIRRNDKQSSRKATYCIDRSECGGCWQYKLLSISYKTIQMRCSKRYCSNARWSKRASWGCCQLWLSCGYVSRSRFREYDFSCYLEWFIWRGKIFMGTRAHISSRVIAT